MIQRPRSLIALFVQKVDYCVRPPRGVCEPHLHLVSLEQFHHKPMGMYGDGLLKLAL